MNRNMPIEIIPFEPALAPYFRDLNVAWLQKYFYVEPTDEEMLSNPEQYILAKEGQIFFARVDGQIAGTFALMKKGEGIYELGKMAVAEAFQGKGAGNALLAFCLEEARQLGAKKVILYSHTKLLPALHLYRKYGFVEIPLDDSEYKRPDIKMEKVL